MRDQKRCLLSEEFKKKVKQAGLPLYRLSLDAGLRPPTFHGWLSGVNRPSRNDPRLIIIAKRLKFPEEKIFISTESDNAEARDPGAAKETERVDATNCTQES